MGVVGVLWEWGKGVVVGVGRVGVVGVCVSNRKGCCGCRLV